MQIHSTLRKQAVAFVTILVAIALFLTACGTNSGSPAGSGSTPQPTTVPGYGTSNGCPSDVVVTAPQTAANVTVKFNQVNSTVTAHNGDVIEIDLPFGRTWGGPTVSQGVLELQPPAGYASKTTNMCIWRFTAKGVGSTQLNFTARALCKKGQLCPMYIMAVPFTVVVK